jgi:hypothetical protein
MSNGFGSFGGGGNNNGNPPGPGALPAGGGFGGGGFGEGGGFGGGGFGTPTPAQPMPAIHIPGQAPTPAAFQGNGRRLTTTVSSAAERSITSDGRTVKLQVQNGLPESLKNGGDCWIDGVCVFDPKAGEAATSRVIVWTTNGNGTVDTANVTALRHKADVQNTGDVAFLTDAGNYVRVPSMVGRVVAVEDIFSLRGFILYGDNAKTGTVLPDYPMASEWVPLVDGLPEKSYNGGTLEYRIKLKGMDGHLVRRYRQAEIDFAGEPPDVETHERHLRMMVWPARPTPTWKLFVVEVGAFANAMAWFGKFQWSLYHHPMLRAGSGSIREDDNRVMPCRALKDGTTPLVRNYEGAFDKEMPLRVATADRPHYIELGRLSDPTACATLSLMPRLTATEMSAPAGQPESWGVDIGTSNSCLTRLGTDPLNPNATRAQVINFNQVFDPMDPDGSLVLCRLGDPRKPRSDLHWMPGLEGAGYRDVIQNEVIDQIPSRLALLVTGRMPRDLNSTEIRELTPMCEVVVPPLQSRTTFANQQVDDRTVDNLKWVDKTEDRRLALLEQYITSLLLMAAARVRPTAAVAVHFSQPLSFTQNQRDALQSAVTRACERVTGLIGVDVTGKVDSDESHCILEEFTNEAKAQAGAPVWVLCDIGGGSIDLAVAMGAAVDGSPKPVYAFLAADSIKFGANLVFKNVLELAGQQLANTSHVPTQQQVVREMISRSGFQAVVAKCTPQTRQRIVGIIQCYYHLVVEYVARTVAGTVRNPKRFKHVAQASHAQGGFGWPDIPAEQFQLELHLLVTGNGFKTFEAISDGRSERQMEDFKDVVRQRVHELLRFPTELPGSAGDDDAWFGQVPMPVSKGYLGLTSGQPKRYLKEALAYSIIQSGGFGGSGGSEMHADDFLAAPNGLTEYSQGIAMMGKPGANRPWYAFVGSSRVKASRPDAAKMDLDTAEPWFIKSPNVTRDERYFKPGMPDHVTRWAQQLNWNIEVGQVYQAHAAEIARQLANQRGERQWSLLKLVYEVGYTRLFSPNDFLS